MNLKKLRNNAGYTQKEMAQKLNVSQGTYSQYENNILEPNIDTLIRLANIFQITVDLLVERKWEIL